jgi:hypothetical protein
VSEILNASRLYVRATSNPSSRTGGREFVLLDADQRQIGGVRSQTGSTGSILYRLLEGIAASRSGSFEVRDQSGALVFRVTHRAAGPAGGVRGEVTLADGRPVVTVTTRGQGFTIADPDGTELATGGRAGRVWLRVTGPGGGQYAEVDREANTLSAQRAGTAHPNSQLVRFDGAAPLAVRLGTLAAVVIRENRIAV